MKIFISSLITGMEPVRAAVREAIEQLGHDAVMAEDFGAQPNSPQVACLDGLRQSGLVILILGERYGAKQASGLSATHEEYREAKGQRPVIAFVQENVDREPEEAEFMREVQGWESGLFRGGFSTPEQLRSLATRAIHQWELSNAAGPVDGEDMLRRALAAIPEERRNRHDRTALVVSFAGGPAQSLLRPSEIENAAFAEELMQNALFGANKLFSPSVATDWAIESHDLIIRQEEGGSVRLDTQGGMVFHSPLGRSGFGPVVIEEDVTAALAVIFRYADWLLGRIDATQRLSHVAPVLAFVGTDTLVWRTRSEQNASPNSYSMGMGNSEKSPVHLTPAHRPRAALALNASQLIEDLVALLRREWKQGR